MKSITPNIFVKDLSETIQFYNSIGFQLISRVPEEGKIIWAMMNSGSVNFMFQTFESLGNELPSVSRENGGSLLLYLEVENIEEFYEGIKNKVHVLKGLEKTFYGATEFSIEDKNGYVLTFAENKEQS